MRPINSKLLADIQNGVQTTATCLRVVRADGIQLGFTTADAGFNYEFLTVTDVYGSIYYSPVSSFEPSAQRSTEDLAVDNLEIIGILSDDAITVEDLVCGKYDEAIVTIFTVNYLALNHGELIKEHGYVGQVIKTDGMYKVEIMSLIGRLKRFLGIVTQPTCRVKVFADGVTGPFTTVNGLSYGTCGQCKLNPTPFTYEETISYVNDEYRFGFNDTQATGYFTDGIITFTSGKNSGVSREINTHTNVSGVAELVLAESFPLGVEIGDTCTVIMGCPRSFSFCKALGNANNFRGEPFLPGNQVTTQVGRAPSK